MNTHALFNKLDKVRILIAAGGTGGHLMPAIEVAKQLESLSAIPKGRLRIEFVGVGRPVEMAIMSREGFVSHSLPALGLKGKGLKGFYSFIKILPRTYSETKKLLKSFKPHIVIGFGGYPSVMPILGARLIGLPSWIHESDSSAGWATKLLALFTSKVSSAFEGVKLLFGRKALYTGHPLRAGISPCREPVPGFVPKKILILGGSQGAQSLDEAMPTAIKALGRQDLEILHQTRPTNCASVLEQYQQRGIVAEVTTFITDISKAYIEADLIVSRAGAGAVMELSVLNKPVLFVPLPNVSGHQHTNAKTLGNFGKAVIVEEGANFSLRIEDALAHALQPSVYREMILKPLPSRKMNASETIATGVLDLCLETPL